VIGEPISQAKKGAERHMHFVKIGDRAINMDNVAQIEHQC
jgi:hypothetical protein